MPVGEIKLQVVEIDGTMRVLHDRFYTGSEAGATPKGPFKYDKLTPPVPSWTDNGLRWAWWGDTDLLPTIMRQKIEEVPMAGAVLDKKIKMLLGTRLIYFKNSDLKDGPDVNAAVIPEIDDWLEENRIQTEWLPAQCTDYSLPFNSFSEVIFSGDGSRVTGLYHIAAEHARLSKANLRNQVDWLVVSMHFPFGTAQADQNRVAIPLYKWYDRKAFLAGLTGRKMAWHTRWPTPGLIYYARPWWLGLFKDNGWLDVSGQVPLIVNAMQNNQIALKYIIAISETYFIARHPDWSTYTAAKRQEIIDSKIDDLNAYLTGSKNVFKSVSYVFKENEITGQPFGKIEITAVDDKAKTGTWVPDSNAADAQIVQGFGMDPSQVGLAPEGGKMGAGSGSDKRVSFNILLDLNTPDQRLILEPLNWISRFNKWDVTFMIDHNSQVAKNVAQNGVVPGQNTPQLQ